MLLRDYIKNKKCIMDGALGTYYEQLYHTQEQPELANTANPDRILAIHRAYLEAGATVIRTNTFGSNRRSLHVSAEEVRENLTAAYRIAEQAVDGREDCYVFCDVGPIVCDDQYEMEEAEHEYLDIVRHFYSIGGRNFLFETFSSLESIADAVDFIKSQPDTFLMINFHVNQFGYTAAGLSLRYLLQEAANMGADSVGCNCAIGPGHMRQMLAKVELPKTCCISVLPNAGYPKRVLNRIVFSPNNEDYFAENCARMLPMGVDFIGGCCGTTPETIRHLVQKLNLTQKPHTAESEETAPAETATENHAFWNTGDAHKLIAVELAPPFDTNDTKLMEAAHLLSNAGVDVLTFPDSPSGRTRLDPILIANKVYQETQLPVMPHICCRDKNSLALRSQLLGAKINGIHNFLLITGDPVNVQSRDSVKSVFQFDSIGLMNVANNINEEMLSDNPLCYGGAINQGRRNLDIEINRVKRKMQAGATFFLTQPVFSDTSIERLRTIKEQTGARILCGIMPFVSRKNASFMKNEISGIDVPDEIIARYPEHGTKAEGEAVGVAIAKEMMQRTADFVDGYYFSFPFNRVYLLQQILEK